MATWVFPDYERRALLGLLQNFDSVAVRGGLCAPLLVDLGARLKAVCGDANLVCAGYVAFDGADGFRYFANAGGLWRFGDRGELVSPRDWWMAVLATHAKWLGFFKLSGGSK